MSNKAWVGLDLGHEKTNVCISDDFGGVLHEQECRTDLSELERALSLVPISNIGLIAVEAGAGTHVVRKLRAQGYPVAIFEARKASRFLAIRRNKTDLGDAKGLADLARLGRSTVSQVYLKSLECQQLRSELAMRHKIVQLRVALEAALRSRLALYGRPFKPASARSPLREQIQADVNAIRTDEGIDLDSEVMPVVEFCDSLRGYLKRLNDSLEKKAAANPVCKLFMEVPGVGPICALSFFSAVEDPTRFRRTSDIAPYLGLVPRRYQSGDNSKTLGITKSGNKLTRLHLCSAATVLRSRGPDCALKNWAVQLQERIGRKRANVAVARKLAIVLLTMWRAGKSFEPYPARIANLVE